MKVISNTLLAILTIGLIFNSCRKGEDDPFVSFRSRDQRLIGKWKLVEEKISTEEINSQSFGYVIGNNSKTCNEFYRKKVFQSDASPTKLTYNTQTYERSKQLILYGDTLNVLDSLNNAYDGTLYEDSSYSGTYEIIVDIKKNFEVEENIRINATFFKKYKKQGKSNYIYDCNYVNPEIIDESFEYPTMFVDKEIIKKSYWYWIDRNKTQVAAGYMHGKITRLSNNEIIINYSTINNTDETPDDPSYFSCFSNGMMPVISPVRFINKQYSNNLKKTYYQKWERIK
ncbi:MAG TPA: hypothetical protein PLP65_01545 [Bacteroidales bacterium]|nr:hypothetical protein [Bacteroidales bacterium]